MTTGDLPCAEKALVVQVTPYYPPHLGGLENVAKAVAEGLAQHGPVLVLTSRSGSIPGPKIERRENLVIRRLFSLEFAHVPFIPALLPRLLFLPRRAVVHVHIAVAFVPEMVWLASLVRRRPYVAHFHLDVAPSGYFGPIFTAYKRFILPGVLRAAAKVIVLSKDQGALLRARYRVAPERIVVVPNAVGADFFCDPTQSPSHSGPFRLLFVGRLAPQKNVALLLRSMAEVTGSTELVIVGDGEQRAMLQDLLAELNLPNVRMIGPKTGDDLIAWYRWADAFVLTSEKEGMPLVLLEAMAGGLPVIGTDVPGISDTVGADGLLASEDPKAFAREVDRLAGDPKLWGNLARRSYERGRQYEWSEGIKTLEEVYEGILA